MIECPQCGRACEPGTNFCPACGTRLNQEPVSGAEVTHTITAVSEDDASSAVGEHGYRDTMPTEVLRAIKDLPKGRALLVVEHGPDSGARFLLDVDETTAGRHPDSGIFLDDITVSRHHATFSRTEQGFTVSDRGSLNGTYVNRSLAETDTVLRAGDEVQIGKYRMVFCTNEQTSEHGRN